MRTEAFDSTLGKILNIVNGLRDTCGYGKHYEISGKSEYVKSAALQLQE